ncbi:UDP-glucuronosyltransferase 2A3-like [Ylistrum balloti]|uniref:UDP-glucuronosyltransferase 2A3-like n=1 Tax=Ylistrum balloti TaxID=509963 RepID=UPI002905D833|nr:UDP-glucuronosyltransferase 2A3-like [Ylistrum balloti]
MPYVYPVHSEHILVISFPTISHTRSLIQLLDSVTQTYNHTATVITTTMVANDVKLQFGPAVDIVISSVLDEADFVGKNAKVAREICVLKEAGIINVLGLFDLVTFCNDFHNEAELLKHLKNRNFDLAIVDNVPIAECFASLAYKLGLPYINFGINYDPVRMRIPFSPASISPHRRLVIGDKLDFLERMQSVFTSIVLELAPSYLLPITNVAKYVSGGSPITGNQLMSKASFHLITLDFLIDYPQPSLPHVAFVGGMNTKPSEPLPEIFQEFLDSSVDGAVIVSLGAGFNGFPNERINTFIRAFKRRPEIHFIIKHSVSEYREDNVMVSPWIPQNDLLGHPKIIAFMTHCGKHSQFEALYHGVPMIGFPLCHDQYYNCERMKEKGYGFVLNFCSFTVNDIEVALETVITQKNFQYNIRNASQVFHSRSDTPLQRASYWIDHIIRYGDKFVHSYSSDMPWYQYYLLDILLVVGMMFGAVVYFTAFLFHKLRYIFGQLNKRVLDKIKTN